MEEDAALPLLWALAVQRVVRSSWFGCGVRADGEYRRRNILLSSSRRSQ